MSALLIVALIVFGALTLLGYFVFLVKRTDPVFPRPSVDAVEDDA